MILAECLFETWGEDKLTYFLITTAESFAKQQEFFLLFLSASVHPFAFLKTQLRYLSLLIYCCGHLL